MNHDNQTLIILFLGIALLMSLYLRLNEFTTFILGIFGGIFTQKTMTEHQNEKLNEMYEKEYEDETQN